MDQRDAKHGQEEQTRGAELEAERILGNDGDRNRAVKQTQGNEVDAGEQPCRDFPASFRSLHACLTAQPAHCQAEDHGCHHGQGALDG